MGAGLAPRQDWNALGYSGMRPERVCDRRGRVWLCRGRQRGQQPESDRVGPNEGREHEYKVGDGRGRPYHDEHRTTTAEDGHTDQDGHRAVTDDDRDNAHSDEHSRQNANRHDTGDSDDDGHNRDLDLDEPCSGRGSRRRRGGCKQRTVL